jgi:hypothetical protein
MIEWVQGSLSLASAHADFSDAFSEIFSLLSLSVGAI